MNKPLRLDGRTEPDLPVSHYLDNRIYTDPDVFARERSRIFSQCWKFVLHTSEIDDPGDFALEKMTYDDRTGMVIYHSKFHASLKRNYQLLPALQWLKLLLAHIPDKYEHLVRYYGYYSNRARGERKNDTSADNTSTLHIDETPADRKSKAIWARLIQKVYEVAYKDVGG